MGKNILNKSRTALDQNKKNDIEIFDDKEHINLVIRKDAIKRLSVGELQKQMLLHLFPILMTTGKITGNLKVTNSSKAYPHIAFFIEDVGHYTGGRYSTFFHAVILSQVTKVTVVSNLPLTSFIESTKDSIATGDINFIVDPTYCINQSKNYFDVVVGCPIRSGEFARAYKDKWNNVKLFLVVFESPNFVRQYRDGVDATEDFWSNYKKCLMVSDGIICPSFLSKQYIKEWDERFRNKQIHVLHPALNLLSAKSVGKGKKNKLPVVVVSSRLADFKNPINIIEKLNKKIECEFVIIGKVWPESMPRLNELIGNEVKIKLLGTIDDKTKFETIANADLLIMPSLFEGFGMPPMEALFFDVPVVAYDLPVLRETYADSIHYVAKGNENEFTKVCKAVINSPNKNNNRNKKNIYKKCSPAAALDRMMKIFSIPRVTSGVIVYNGSDYLKYSVEGMAKRVRHVVIVEGAVKKYNADGFRSNDGTIEILENLVRNDFVGKFVVISVNRFWENKIEMQNVIAKNVSALNTDFYVKVDCDEFWHENEFEQCIDYMLKNKDVAIIRPKFIHFWLSFKNIAVDAGGKWGTRHPRIWRWDNDFVHTTSFNFFVHRGSGRAVIKPFYDEHEIDFATVYHCGYVRTKKRISQKLLYYKTRGIERIVIDTYTAWTSLDSPTQTTQSVRSWAEKFHGKLPKALINHPYNNYNDVRKIENEQKLFEQKNS